MNSRTDKAGDITDSVYSWAGCVVCACVCTAIGDMLISGTALEKTARFVFGLFLLCSVILPLGDIDEITALLTPEGMEPDHVVSDTEGLETSVIEERLSRLGEEKLEEKDIDGAECEVSLICEEGEITEIQCRVYLTKDTAASRTRAEEILRTELGFVIV